MTSLQKNLLAAAENNNVEIIKDLIGQGVKVKTPYDEALEDAIKFKTYYHISFLLRIQESFLHFQRTKKIPKDLFPLFDQNGNWWGLRYKEGTFGELERMGIPKEKLEAVDPQGRKHLLSSFVSDSQRPEILDYYTIQGDLAAYNSLKIESKNLTSVGFGLLLQSAQECYFPKLQECGGAALMNNAKNKLYVPELVSTGSHFACGFADKLDVPKLSYVEGDFIAWDCKEIHAPVLNHVGSDLTVSNTNYLELSELEKVGGDLGAYETKTLFIPKLQSIGGSVPSLGENPKVFAPKLTEVKGAMPPSFLKFLRLKQLSLIKNSTTDQNLKEEIKKEVEKRAAQEKALEEIKGEGLSL